MKQHWNEVQANAAGTRGFSQQMTLDAVGCRIVTAFFEQVMRARVTPISDAKLQARGVDLAVKLGRHTCPVDVKGDGSPGRNLAAELISQDRPNAVRTEPADGYISKDSALVAYLIMRTGELYVFDMKALYPVLWDFMHACIAGPARVPELLPGNWLTSTPNASYLSHNLLLPAVQAVALLPAVTYFYLPELLGVEAYRALSGRELEARVVPAQAVSADQTVRLATVLRATEGYDVKPSLTAEDKERLNRFVEAHTRFASIPAVREAGQALIERRRRLPLPEDEAAFAG